MSEMTKEAFIQEANATIEAIETQRNDALNKSVRLTAALILANAKITALEAENKELKAAGNKKAKRSSKSKAQEKSDGDGNSVNEHKSD